MSFANPLLLLGLLGASVPIIIHLIHRHRPRRQMFAAMELLLRSIERVERRMRLKRLLLLAARVALLAALALAAAGPLIGSEQVLSVTSRGPRRLAIVVDTSLSMHARYGDRTAFARALAQARSLVDGMGPEDQATLVAARASPEVLLPRPTGSKRELLDAIDRLAPTFGRAELGEAVTAAAQALSSLADPAHATGEGSDPGGPAPPPTAAQIVLLSDLAGHGLRSAADLSLGAGRAADLAVVDVLADVAADKRVNRGLIGLEAANVPGSAPRTVELRARIQSFTAEKAGEAQPAAITLVGSGGTLEAGSVDLTPGTIADKVLVHAFEEAGVVPVEVHLEPDVLAEDDVRYATADVRRQVRVLIVDGAPSGVPKEDEIYYLERAIAAGAQDQPPPFVVTADELPRVDLGAYDVLILAGVNVFPPSEGARIVEFVERGGGLLVTMSADLDLELYNAELGRILPRTFRALRVTDAETGGVGATGAVTLANPRREHPVMEVFDEASLPGLLSAKTRAYVLLEPGGKAELVTLVEFDDGQPALIEGRAGQGRVIVLATSIDRDLTDLPIRPAFVPLVRRLLLQLGGGLSKPDPRVTLVGDPRPIRIPKDASRIVVTAPDGQEVEWTGAALTAGPEVSFAATTRPGHYKVSAVTRGALEPLDDEGFDVNLDPRESDLRPLSVEEAAATLHGTADLPPDASPSAVARSKALRGLSSPEGLVSALLLLMCLAFVLEGALTAQRVGS